MAKATVTRMTVAIVEMKYSELRLHNLITWLSIPFLSHFTLEARAQDAESPLHFRMQVVKSNARLNKLYERSDLNALLSFAPN
jgi:hypothetical protein